MDSIGDFFALANEMDNLVNPRRVRIHNGTEQRHGPVLYWMHREFRAKDNWGLIWARQQALRLGTPVAVAFCLAPSFLGATLRQYDFLLGGLEETAEGLRAANIPLILRSGEPAEEMLRLCGEIRPSLVVTDFDPLRIKKQWHHTLLEQLLCPVHEVDSRNIVPAWIASTHREFMARTFRPRIHPASPGISTSTVISAPGRRDSPRSFRYPETFDHEEQPWSTLTSTAGRRWNSP